MKSFKILSILFVLLITTPVISQEKPKIGFEDLMITAEKDFQNTIDARELAEVQNLPHTIYLTEGIFIEAKGVEENRVVYTIINNLAHPFNNGDVAFWTEIKGRFNLSNARVHWANKPTQNPTLGINYSNQSNPVVSLLMVPESTNDAVMSINAFDGSLISMSFIPSDPTNLGIPIEALLTPNATILVSDQNSDQIVEYDTMGVFVRILFGSNPSVLDNCRGIELRPGANSVLGTIGSGANQDAVPEFDLTTGSYLGNFIVPNATLMDGPFDIIFRASDCLVNGQASNNVVKYDLTGSYIGDFVASINFPEQLTEADNSNVLVTNFTSPSGLYIYDSNGTQLSYFSSVTGARGNYQLGNGNYIVTNGSGVFVLDETSGTVLSQPVSGVSARFVREYDLSIVPVELTSFTADVIDEKVVLNWNTATETNNSGFQVERSKDKVYFEQVAFVPGFGTTAEPKSYSYNDNSVTSGTYCYRLKQIDYDGSFTYSEVVEVNLGLPTEFALEHNYPNPFNPNTTIKYQIPELSFVTIKIYDVLGNDVATLMNEEKPIGTHTIEFNATNLPSGIYFYQLQTPNFTQTKKMILLK